MFAHVVVSREGLSVPCPTPLIGSKNHNRKHFEPRKLRWGIGLVPTNKRSCTKEAQHRASGLTRDACASASAETPLTTHTYNRYLVEWWMASELTRSEVQVLRLESTATSDTLTGNFRLSWGDGGEETDYLPADVGEVELEAALEALGEIRDVQVPWITSEPCL